MEELYEKMERKQRAKEQFELERRREAAARSREAEKRHLLQAKRDAEARRSRELSEAIARRLQSAARRRQRCLEMIAEHTGTSGCAVVLAACEGGVACALGGRRADSLRTLRGQRKRAGLWTTRHQKRRIRRVERP